MIEDRTRVADGTRLVATWKGTTYTATCHADDKGKIRVTVDGFPEEFGSLSNAGGHITDPSPCNGWNFWSIEGDPVVEKAPRGRRATPAAPSEDGVADAPKRGRAKKTDGDAATPTTPATPRPKSVKPNITKMRKQHKDSGKVGYFCSACQDGFYIEEGTAAPTVCPAGHPKHLTADIEADADSPTVETEDILF